MWILRGHPHLVLLHDPHLLHLPPLPSRHNEAGPGEYLITHNKVQLLIVKIEMKNLV